MTSEIPSPCIRLCTLDAAGRICIGCLRTLDEIGCWSSLSSAERTAILEQLPGRRAALEGPAGARCDNCGAAFRCGAGEPAPCWCAGYPPLEPTSPDARCLCPSCLAAAQRRE